jgi:acyl-coenzyme A thioesterase PaaI-like protein
MARTLWRETLYTRLFAFWKIPLLFFTRPAILELSDRACLVRLPYRRRNKNHLGSLYFAAFAAGADTACGLLAMHHIRKSGAKASLIFKEFRAEFLKRAEGDTTFSCTAGEELAELVRRVVASGERDHATVEVIATVPSKFGDEPVARFEMTISLKRRD